MTFNSHLDFEGSDVLTPSCFVLCDCADGRYVARLLPRLLSESARVLRKGGVACLLTCHPDIVTSGAAARRGAGGAKACSLKAGGGGGKPGDAESRPASRHAGVSWSKRDGKWRAIVPSMTAQGGEPSSSKAKRPQVKGGAPPMKFLGVFDDEEAAAAAIQEAKRRRLLSEDGRTRMASPYAVNGPGLSTGQVPASPTPDATRLKPGNQGKQGKQRAPPPSTKGSRPKPHGLLVESRRSVNIGGLLASMVVLSKPSSP